MMRNSSFIFNFSHYFCMMNRQIFLFAITQCIVYCFNKIRGLLVLVKKNNIYKEKTQGFNLFIQSEKQDSKSKILIQKFTNNESNNIFKNIAFCEMV